MKRFITVFVFLTLACMAAFAQPPAGPCPSTSGLHSTALSGSTVFGCANGVNNGLWFPVYALSGSQFLGTDRSVANCSSSASPAVCAAAEAGSVVVAAAATTVVVNTQAVTANSQILLTFDSSLGTKLSVTCNTTYLAPYVTARTAGSSFTITLPSAPSTNPQCISYRIIN